MICNIISWMSWEIYLFSSVRHLICFIWTEPEKTSNTIVLANTDSWFIPEYHFHPIVHTPWLFLFSPLSSTGYVFWFSLGLSLCKSHFIKLISYSSFTNSCFDTFVLLCTYHYQGILHWAFYPDAFLTLAVNKHHSPCSPRIYVPD